MIFDVLVVLMFSLLHNFLFIFSFPELLSDIESNDCFIYWRQASEVMKIEYQRKVALLNKQKKHGVHSKALEKIKSAVSHLHARYIVDMQAMDSTVSEINHLRDDKLYPKLVDLVDG